MTTQNLDLQKMGLAPMTDAEMQSIEGGSIFSAIGNAVSSAVNAVGSAISSAADYASCLYDNLSITVFGVTIKQGCSCSCSD